MGVPPRGFKVRFSGSAFPGSPGPWATTGLYAGIVFFQPSGNTKTLTVSANASGITGTIYAPGAPLSESGNGAVTNAFLIVDTLTISGSRSALGPTTPKSTIVAGPTTLTTTTDTAAVVDQTIPNTIPVTMTIKVTDAQGKNVSSSSLPMVSMSVVGSGGNLVPQPGPESSLSDNLSPFDAVNGSYRFNLKTKGYELG